MSREDYISGNQQMSKGVIGVLGLEDERRGMTTVLFQVAPSQERVSPAERLTQTHVLYGLPLGISCDSTFYFSKSLLFSFVLQNQIDMFHDTKVGRDAHSDTTVIS